MYNLEGFDRNGVLGVYLMAEIEEELTYSIESQNISFNDMPGHATLTINCTSMSRMQMATLIWLINNGPMLELTLRDKT